MKINKEGIELIKEWESFSSKPYPCAGSVPTIGFGNTYYEDGTSVRLSDPPISIERAELLLNFTLRKFEQDVEKLIKVPVSVNQFSAIVSFAYNVGVGNLKKSTLLKKLNQNDFIGASNEFSKWVNSGGKKLNGLVKRREAEKELFLK